MSLSFRTYTSLSRDVIIENSRLNVLLCMVYDSDVKCGFIHLLKLKYNNFAETGDQAKLDMKRLIIPVLVSCIVVLVVLFTVTLVYFVFIRPRHGRLFSKFYRLTTVSNGVIMFFIYIYL